MSAKMPEYYDELFVEAERRGTQPYRVPEKEFLPPEDTQYL